MFSNIGKIAGRPTRHAEETDTRQHIQRHDPDQRRRSEDETEETKDPFTHEDSAIVTISTLRLFLENFLKSLEPKPQETKAQDTKVATPSPQVPPAAADSPPKDNPAAQAAHAYQSASRTRAASTHPTPQMNEAEAKALLGAEDVRTIHTLIEDVKSLEQRGVEFLKIEKGESFLHSLSAAVKALKP